MLKNRVSLLGLSMWLCAATFYGFQFLIRVSPSYFALDMMEALSLESCVIGTVSSFYYTGYAFMQIPAGIFLDLAGPRRPLTVACLLCGLGCLIFSHSITIEGLAFGRFLMGVGSAFGFLTCIRIASTWFHPGLLSFFVGLSLVIGTMGPRFGGKILCVLVADFGWQRSLLFFALGCIALALLSWGIVRDGHTVTIESKSTPAASPSLKEVGMDAVRALYDLAANRQTWIYGLYGFLMYVPLSGFADLWGVPYLKQVFHMTSKDANDSVMTLYLGVGCGSIVWPGLVHWFKSYRSAMGASALLTMLFLTPAIYMNNLSVMTIEVLFFITGAMASGQFLAFTGVAHLNPVSRTATASGMHNMLCMISGILMQPFMGYILQSCSGNNGITKPFTVTDYHYAFMIVPISLLIALLIVFFMRDTYALEIDELTEEPAT